MATNYKTNIISRSWSKKWRRCSKEEIKREVKYLKGIRNLSLIVDIWPVNMSGPRNYTLAVWREKEPNDQEQPQPQTFRLFRGTP